MSNFQRQPAIRKSNAFLIKSSFLDQVSSSYLGGVPSKVSSSFKLKFIYGRNKDYFWVARAFNLAHA